MPEGPEIRREADRISKKIVGIEKSNLIWKAKYKVAMEANASNDISLIFLFFIFILLYLE